MNLTQRSGFWPSLCASGELEAPDWGGHLSWVPVNNTYPLSGEFSGPALSLIAPHLDPGRRRHGCVGLRGSSAGRYGVETEKEGWL